MENEILEPKSFINQIQDKIKKKKENISCFFFNLYFDFRWVWFIKFL